MAAIIGSAAWRPREASEEAPRSGVVPLGRAARELRRPRCAGATRSPGSALRRGSRRRRATRNRCARPREQAAALLCPDLRVGPPSDCTSSSDGGRDGADATSGRAPLLHAARQRSRGRWPMELRDRATSATGCVPTRRSTGSAAATSSVVRTEASSTSTTSATSSAAPTGRSTSSLSMEIWTRARSAVAHGVVRDGPEALLLPARPRARPGR